MSLFALGDLRSSAIVTALYEMNLSFSFYSNLRNYSFTVQQTTLKTIRQNLMHVNISKWTLNTLVRVSRCLQPFESHNNNNNKHKVQTMLPAEACESSWRHNVLHCSSGTVCWVARSHAIVIYRPWAPPPTWAGCGLREGPVPSEYSGGHLETRRARLSAYDIQNNTRIIGTSLSVVHPTSWYFELYETAVIGKFKCLYL